MSDNSDDDIWARVRKEQAEKSSKAHADPLSFGIEVEAAERSRGSLEKRASTDTTTNKMTWETTEEETDGPTRPTKRRRKAKPTQKILLGSLIVALLWLIGAGLFLIQNAGTFGANGSTLLFSLVVLLLGPAFALLAGVMGESIAKSNRDARTLISAARKMLEPELTGENTVRTTALAVRGEIGRLEGAIGEVADRLRLIEGNVESQTSALSAAGNNARGGADQLVATMENERQRLDALLAAMADLTTQAQASTQIAAQSIDERAGKLAQAAESLVDRSTQASDLAAGAAQRLDLAAQRAVDAIGELDRAAGRGEAALARAHDLMVLARLRADEAVGSVGNAVASLHNAAASASETARVVSETIQSETNASRDAGLATVEEIRLATVTSAQMVTQALRSEAEAATIAGAQTLAALQASAEAVRFAAEEAHEQSNQQIADNQRRLDTVRQTAFEAGKDADTFMQTRITDARALIEQSAGLLDETGTKIQERFGRLAGACADQARAVEDLLDTLDRRLEHLPKEATDRAAAIESALSDTLQRLTEAGRKAADETAALDSAFQNRLRDSYSALGEVVQRLGGLSGVLAMPAVAPQVIVAPVVEAPANPPPANPPAMAPPAAVPAVAAAPLAASPAPITPQLASNTTPAEPERELIAPPKPSEQDREPARVIREQPAAAAAPAPPPPSPDAVQRRSISLSSAPLNQAPPRPLQVPAPAPPSKEAPAQQAKADDAPPSAPAPTPPSPASQEPPKAAPTQAPMFAAPSRLKISSPMPVEDDPFAELQIGRAAKPPSETAGGWSWKQVLSTLDEKGAKAETTRIATVFNQLNLEAAVDDKILDRLRTMASRSRDQARRGTRDLLPDQVRAMRQKLTADPDLRATIVRFVEARRESAARGRLAGNEARVYLVADAALEA
jgi:methyl-accepting chemotaxis protein